MAPCEELGFHLHDREIGDERKASVQPMRASDPSIDCDPHRRAVPPLLESSPYSETRHPTFAFVHGTSNVPYRDRDAHCRCCPFVSGL
jgi:hypothetical protein